MKSGTLHTLIIVVILIVSILSGILFDLICTHVERGKYPESYAGTVFEYAATCRVPKALLFAVIRTESNFSEDLVSEDGKIGLMQISPETYRTICKIMPGENTEEPASLYDAAHNIRSGAFWLEYLYIRYRDWDTVLAAYHAGIDTVDAWLGDSSLTDKAGKKLLIIPDKTVAALVDQINDTKAVYERLYKY